MTFQELVASTIATRAGDEALEFAGRTYTFADLDARAERLAQLLTARGFVAGDRLAVYLENRIEFIDLFFACLRLGVIFLPINILYRDREVSHIVSDAEPKAIVASGPGPGGFEDRDVTDIPNVGRDFSPGNTASPAVEPGLKSRPTTDKSSPAAIVYTSGTTGTAKGAILTHGNFAANALAVVDAWRITRDDRFLLSLPLFHVHGLGNGIGGWMASGCRMRLLERFDINTAAAEFLSFRPTLFFGVPTIYVRLITLPDDVARQIGGAMRLFVSGSAPLPPEIFEKFRTRYGHAILERYGMTETFMNAGNPYDGERRPGTIGHPFPGVDIRIVKPDGADVGPDEEGQIMVRGANVFAGYWRRPDATKNACVNGFFKTGDIAKRSADGYIKLCGRMSDLIISGGFNIYPRELEEALLAVPGVREAAVVGAPDSVRGEVPVAYLVADATVDDEALREKLRADFASFKLPRAFIRMDALPRTALGKVQRHLLPPWRG